MSDLLVEIGCENLPPHAIRPAFDQLEKDTVARLEELRLDFDDVYATGAARRIVLIVRGLAERQAAKTEVVTGPPVAKGFDDAGKPTQAAVGFARSQGIEVGTLKRIPTDRGEYLGFSRQLKSMRAATLLKTVVPDLIGQIRFPKVMHWEESQLRFGRPIRWVVCLLGSTVIRFTIAGVTSGHTTQTIPWIHRRGLRVKNARHYLSVLGKAGITLDHEKRYLSIATLAKRTAARAGFGLIEDAGLFNELCFMLEGPRPLLGSFDKRYLKLPADVVVTAMKSHQRYLALTGKRGKLVPNFITFTEGRVGSPARVRNGNEKVLRARLEDALFYWHEDVKTGLDGLADRLQRIVFIEGLGTLADKGGRVRSIAKRVNGMDRSDSAIGDSLIDRASHLAKADVASEMIKDGKEFTLLQGLIGSYYAREAGEPDDVVLALAEQYLPRSGADSLPTTRLGVILSIADRVDTIVGCFLAGFAPTGSQDPYALRRQANGLMRLIETRSTIRIDELLEHAIDSYRRDGLVSDESAGTARSLLVEFFKTRVASFLKDAGIAYDIVAAVTAVAWATPAVALQRARAFQDLRGDAAFELLITGARRVGNILADERKVYGVDVRRLQAAFDGSESVDGLLSFDRDAFADPEESGLTEAIREAIPRLVRFEEASDAPSILKELSGLGPAIDAYFDGVLVNCPDPALRENRHRFLGTVYALFSKYADFSQIVEAGNLAVG